MTDNITPELLPCPFCGAEAILNIIEPHSHERATWMPDYEGGEFVECTECTSCTSSITDWNNRTYSEQYSEQSELLDKMADALSNHGLLAATRLCEVYNNTSHEEGRAALEYKIAIKKALEEYNKRKENTHKKPKTGFDIISVAVDEYDTIFPQEQEKQND